MEKENQAAHQEITDKITQLTSTIEQLTSTIDQLKGENKKPKYNEKHTVRIYVHICTYRYI